MEEKITTIIIMGKTLTASLQDLGIFILSLLLFLFYCYNVIY